jgi:hypothetical protein
VLFVQESEECRGKGVSTRLDFIKHGSKLFRYS